MSGTTTVEGYPYPLTSDFADVQDAFRLANAIDSDLRGVEAPFRTFMSRPSFIGLQSANASGFISGTQTFVPDTVQWDNTGGLTAGLARWTQPVGQQPTWWMFGATILVAVISGTPVVGDMNLGNIDITTTDQVSGLTTDFNYWQRQDETNTGGERINLFGMGAMYRGFATLSLILNGSTQKAIGAGSRFWGVQLGPVT